MNKIFSDQFDWDELLQLIADKKLTPVIGKEMYCYKDGDTLKPLDYYLSQKILEKNNVTDFQITSLPETFNYLELKKKVETPDLIDALKPVVRGINFELPLLDEFLTISDLNCYINTTVYNNVLENKINDLRKQPITSRNFSIQSNIDDFPVLDKMNTPHVFNVFGSLLQTTDVALSEEDLLEYASSFNIKMTAAPNILGALRDNSLLFLGCSFADWMIRFAMRLLSNQPLHQWGSRKVIVINDPGEKRDHDYEFLKNYRVITYEGSTKDFVYEFARQWKMKNPRKKSIFLSYTRADTIAVENLKRGIEQISNVDCWYDKEKLEAGDVWENKIKDSIRNADLFIPIISANSLDHDDGYVLKEWLFGSYEWRAREKDNEEEKFLVPVVIDDSSSYGEKIQKRFDKHITELNITKIPEGKPNEIFLNQIKKMLDLV
jgi:hypothetical protein